MYGYEAWLQLRFLNSECNRYLSAQNHIIIHGVSCDFKVSVWCVVSATMITGSIFLRS